MDDTRELNLNEMDRVTGGVWKEVNTNIDGMNAALREGPRKSSKQIGSLPNGTQVDVNESSWTYDPESKRHFVMVTVNGKTGWIAASIVGMPR